MGYATDGLGDYRATRDTYGGKAGTTISDPLYTTFKSRIPGFRPGDWVKIVIAPPPIKSPLISFLAPKPATPAPATAPVSRPFDSAPPPPPPSTVPNAPTTAQTAAPLVAAAATGVVGPIAAAIPPIVDAASTPSPTRIRIVPNSAAPVVSLAPVPSDTDGGSIDTTLPAVSEASVAGGNPLDMLKSLPPAVLAAGAGLVLFFLSRRR